MRDALDAAVVIPLLVRALPPSTDTNWLPRYIAICGALVALAAGHDSNRLLSVAAGAIPAMIGKLRLVPLPNASVSVIGVLCELSKVAAGAADIVALGGVALLSLLSDPTAANSSWWSPSARETLAACVPLVSAEERALIETAMGAQAELPMDTGTSS